MYLTKGDVMKFFVISLIVIGFTVCGLVSDAQAGYRVIKKNAGNVTVKGLNPKQISQLKKLAGNYSNIKFNQRGNVVSMQGSPTSMKSFMGKTSAILPTLNGMYLGTGSSEGDVNAGSERDDSRDRTNTGRDSIAGKKHATLTNTTPAQLNIQLKALGINPASVRMIPRGKNVQITSSPQILQQIKNFAGQNRFNPGTNFRPGM